MASFECKYCEGSYSSQGGLTRHYNACAERKSAVECELAAAAAPRIVVQNHQTTVVQIAVIQLTNKQIAEEQPMFDAFLKKFMADLSQVLAEAATAAAAGKKRGGAEILREMKRRAVASAAQSDREIAGWLAGNDIAREVPEGVDSAQLLENTIVQVNKIEDAIIEALSSDIPQEEWLALKGEAQKKGVFGI